MKIAHQLKKIKYTNYNLQFVVITLVIQKLSDGGEGEGEGGKGAPSHLRLLFCKIVYKQMKPFKILDVKAERGLRTS